MLNERNTDILGVAIGGFALDNAPAQNHHILVSKEAWILYIPVYPIYDEVILVTLFFPLIMRETNIHVDFVPLSPDVRSMILDNSHPFWYPYNMPHINLILGGGHFRWEQGSKNV